MKEQISWRKIINLDLCQRALGNANMYVRCAPFHKTSKVGKRASSGEGVGYADKISRHVQESPLITRERCHPN